MVVQTFRPAAKRSALALRVLHSNIAMLAFLHHAPLEERILTCRASGKSISLYDQHKSLNAFRRENAD